MPRTSGPTHRQQQFVKLVRGGCSYRQAALRAGYAPATAKNPWANLLSKPQVIELLTDGLIEDERGRKLVLALMWRDLLDKETTMSQTERNQLFHLLSKAVAADRPLPPQGGEGLENIGILDAWAYLQAGE